MLTCSARRAVLRTTLAVSLAATPALPQAAATPPWLAFADEAFGVPIGRDGLIWTSRDAVLAALGGTLGDPDHTRGFVAASRDQERPLHGTFVRRLVAAHDVTADLTEGLGTDVDPLVAASRLASARARLIGALRSAAAANEPGAELHVTIRPVAGGARYVAETWETLTDLRLAAIPPGLCADRPDAAPRPALDFVLLRARRSGAPAAWREGAWPRRATAIPDDAALLAPPTRPLLPWTDAVVAFHRDLLAPRQLRGVDAAIAQLGARWRGTPAESAALAARRDERAELAATLAAWSTPATTARGAALARALGDGPGLGARSALDAATVALTGFANDGGDEAARHELQRRLPELVRRVATLAHTAGVIEAPTVAMRLVPAGDVDTAKADGTPARGGWSLADAAAAAARPGAALVDGRGRVLAVVSARDAAARLAALDGGAGTGAVATATPASALLDWLAANGGAALVAELTAPDDAGR